MVQRYRVTSGLILMAFATTHLINHAFGLVSLDAMEQVRQSPLGFWHDAPLNYLLLLALIVHIMSSLIGILERRNARMPAWQLGQIVSGVLIPIWLTSHILGTSAIQQVHQFPSSYLSVMPSLWPGLAERQIFMSLLIWTHGCVGIHFWLRQRPFYQRIKIALLITAVLIPALSMSGFVAGGKDLALKIALQPDLLEEWAATFNWPLRSAMAWTQRAESIIIAVFCVLLLATAGWRLGRGALAMRRNKLVVVYEDGTRVRVPPRTSILEASQIAGIPHASICGGRGRCSTCRVRVLPRDDTVLPPPDGTESKVLQRLGAMSEVRLACQLRPVGPVTVARLMSPAVGPQDALKPMDPGQGVEREIVILFADLRGFTHLSESRLPFDVVHLLNRYFRIMGEEIESQGGRIDKFIGDGIMALFGIDVSPEQAATDGLRAASAMGRGLARLNQEMAAELGEPLRMGIGLHLGTAIVGEMGFGQATSMTAVGDAVNTASRLEAACKELGVELVVSTSLINRTRLDIVAGDAHQLELRGRSRPLAVQSWPKADQIMSAEQLAAPAKPRTSLSGLVSAGRRRWMKSKAI